MARTSWRSSADEPYIIARQTIYAKPSVLDVDSGTGSVSVEREDSDGTWRVLEDEDGNPLTFTSYSSNKIDVAGVQDLRIVASGDAKFRWTSY